MENVLVNSILLFHFFLAFKAPDVFLYQCRHFYSIANSVRLFEFNAQEIFEGKDKLKKYESIKLFKDIKYISDIEYISVFHILMVHFSC